MNEIGQLFGASIHADTEDKETLEKITKYLQAQLGNKEKTDADYDKEIDILSTPQPKEEKSMQTEPKSMQDKDNLDTPNQS